MNKHILDTSKFEIEKNIQTLKNYKIEGLSEKIRAFFGKDFSSLFGIYSREKKAILMSYASLFNDIDKDFSTAAMSGEEIQNINNSLVFLSKNIKKCSRSLENLERHKKIEKNIISQEEYFFVYLLESFNNDLLHWIAFHKKNIKDSIKNIDSNMGVQNFQENKAYSKMIKNRLSLLIRNIEKIQEK